VTASKRLYGLDGLRAISIVMVMASHAAGTRLLGGGTIPLGTAHAWGKVGVRVFFVISGFLITKLMFDERQKHGDVSVKNFYVRRAYRIFPAFFAYIGFLIVLRVLGHSTITNNDLVHAATYTTNFDAERHWLVSHIWSLSVEEQFYLVWPLLFAWLGYKRAFLAAVAACLLAPIARLLIVRMLPEHLDSLVWQATPAVADSLATGCVLAFVRNDTARAATGVLGALVHRVLGLTRSTPLTYLLFPAAFFTYLLETRPTVWTLVGVSFSNVAFALCIDRAVHDQSDIIGRVLVNRVVERIGVLSYSLYLWQQLFLRQSRLDGPVWLQVVTSFPVSVILALVVGILSYELVEKPILRRRPKWADR